MSGAENGNGFAVPPSPSLPHEGGEGRIAATAGDKQ